jgi:hypothetical protein
MSKSKGIVDKKVDGGKIRTSYPRDNASSHKLPNTRGKSMGGSTTNLGHSLTGASAVMDSSKKRG